MNIEYKYLSNLEKLSQINNRKKKKSEVLIDIVVMEALTESVVSKALVESMVAEALKRIRCRGNPR